MANGYVKGSSERARGRGRPLGSRNFASVMKLVGSKIEPISGESYDTCVIKEVYRIAIDQTDKARQLNAIKIIADYNSRVISHNQLVEKTLEIEKVINKLAEAGVNIGMVDLSSLEDNNDSDNGDDISDNINYKENEKLKENQDDTN